MKSEHIPEAARRAQTEWGAQQKASELAAFGQFVRDRGCKTLLEIGTYAGGTARFFGTLGLEVTAVDVDLSHIPRLLRRGWHGDFYEGGRELAPTLPRLFDVVFIDADHSLEEVRADWHAWGPKALEIVAFHDIREHRGNWGGLSDVKILWDELKTSGRYPTTEFIADDDEDRAGIGVVDVREI